MIPIRIIADMMSRTVVSDDGLHLDSLLMAAVAKRDGLPPLLSQRQAIDAEPLQIPIALSPCGRYYLATSALGYVEARENRYINRRFPLHESIALGDESFKRVMLSSGACKGFRVPVESSHVDRWTWYAVGDSCHSSRASASDARSARASCAPGRLRSASRGPARSRCSTSTACRCGTCRSTRLD